MQMHTRRHTAAAAAVHPPLAHAGLLVLDELKALDGAKAAQQLAALLVGQVVGDAAHKDAVLGVGMARDAIRGH